MIKITRSMLEDYKVFEIEIKQILSDHEDAKKYKLLMDANSQVVKDNISMSQYQEEITQLKATLHKRADEWLAENIEKEKLIERLEKDHQIIVNVNSQLGENMMIVERLDNKIKECHINAGGMELGKVLHKIKGDDNNAV